MSQSSSLASAPGLTMYTSHLGFARNSRVLCSRNQEEREKEQSRKQSSLWGFTAGRGSREVWQADHVIRSSPSMPQCHNWDISCEFTWPKLVIDSLPPCERLHKPKPNIVQVTCLRYYLRTYVLGGGVERTARATMRNRAKEGGGSQVKRK